MIPAQSGTEIAGYRIESLIGRGGMAVVYRAEDMRLGRKVALKLLTPQLADNEQFRQRFMRESRLAASLDHPNIVPIFEAGEADGQLFIAMRYVIGSDLKGVLLAEENGRLPVDRALRLFAQMGDALDTAHRAGLVHRDVKPANVLVAAGREYTRARSADHVYLTDFGLTKRTSELSGGLTGTGHFLGTVDYVAPEQIQGRPVGPGTDIYALGCVLYECLTGHLPFRRDDDAALLWAHLVEAPPPVTAVRPELPVAVNAVIARAMAKDLPDRYESCEELLRDLEMALGMPAPISAPGGRPTQDGEGAARRADATSDSSRTELGTVTGEMPGGSQHPSFPAGPLPASVPRGNASQGASPPADQGSDPEEYDYGDFAEGADPDWEGDEPGPTAPPRRTRRLVALVAAAAVLLAGAAVLLSSSLLSEDYRTYTSDETVVPFRLQHPADWGSVVSPASDIVLGPRPTAADELFFFKGTPEDWASTADTVRPASPDAVWLYAYTSAAAFDTSSVQALWESVALLLPDESEFDRHREVQVAGAAAHEIEAVAFDPAHPETRLRVLVDVVQPPDARGAVLLAFFAPPDTFEDHRPSFERIRDSLDITR